MSFNLVMFNVFLYVIKQILKLHNVSCEICRILESEGPLGSVGSASDS
mgnify:CR=1 FL=1